MDLTKYRSYLLGEGNEYICDTLESFVDAIALPTPFRKNDGVSFIFINQGRITVKVGYEVLVLEASQMLVVQLGKPYSIESASHEIQGYVLSIKDGGVLGTMGDHSLIFHLDFLDTWSNSFYEINHLPVKFIENIFSRIYWQYNHDRQNLMMVNAYVITLMLEMNGLYNEMTNINRSAIDLSRKFKKLVYQHIETQNSVSSFASLLAVSPNHLNKSVKSATGYSASELISKIKIIEAKVLLMLADTTVADVAVRLGFEDPSYFSRFFKKHENTSPSEYRKMIDMSSL
ncbi:helix-turn-helix domain-containing protein [Aureibacter tunicatorum]|uniref:AraC-like DNA-binding protein n=1 Tax=Aureibacter tunicatorum TaxID=866807 RepID=A0AAE4BPR4_9BACT|nr:helix-turn-helix domain-containing protein [Aureibacter tunicatorum]MDR6238269.1 AraC-like DNA-binding protein [Aureibacter tunicatorum]BDD03302.1 AraC family transcriptional regulator [Aureibacter tunicatorum]